MKKFLLLIILVYFGLINLIQSQPANNWSEPIALTDSVSYNSNPNLLINSLELFYEKKFDLLSPSSIYYQDIYSNEEIAVLSNDSITYRNPLPIVVEYDNHYILYESNQNGNYDIYALEYFFNGNFGDTIQLTATPEDESLLKVSYNYEGSFFGTWIENGSVFVAEIDYYFGDLFFKNIVVIDTGLCLNPVCSYGVVFWQRFENNEYNIYKAEKEASNWSYPQPIYITGNNINLTMTRVLWDQFEPGTVVWENDDEIMYYESYNGEVNTIELTMIDSAYQPSSFYYFVCTGENYGATLSFTAGTILDQEIYVLDNCWGSTLVNISNNNVKDSHSKLFQGQKIGGDWEFYCIWQSHINEHTVLYSSSAWIIFGDIEENKNNELLNVYPNPFKQELKIDFIVSGNETATIEIYTITGKKILSREIQGQTNTWQSFTWNLEKDGVNLSEGIYLVKLSQGASTAIRKVVYSK